MHILYSITRGLDKKDHNIIPFQVHSINFNVAPSWKSLIYLMCVPSQVQLFATSWTVALQPPLSMGFSRQEYWRGLPFSSPGDLPDPGIGPVSPALAGRVFATSAAWEAHTGLALYGCCSGGRYGWGRPQGFPRQEWVAISFSRGSS